MLPEQGRNPDPSVVGFVQGYLTVDKWHSLLDVVCHRKMWGWGGPSDHLFVVLSLKTQKAFSSMESNSYPWGGSFYFEPTLHLLSTFV